MSDGDLSEVFDETERFVVRESRLNATNDFCIWTLAKPTRIDRISCWLNGWLPGGWRLGQVNDHWRFFRI